MIDVQLIDEEGNDLRVSPCSVDPTEGDNPHAKFDISEYEGPLCAGIRVISQPGKAYLLKGGAVDMTDFRDTGLTIYLGTDCLADLKGDCDECFGTGLRGGFTVPCSRGCAQ